VQIGVLGPLDICHDNSRLRLNRRGARALLGILALRANIPTSAEWIVEALWDGAPPRSAAANLRSHLAEVRRQLEPAGPGGPWIESGSGSYTLRASADDLDITRFEALAGEGAERLRAGDPGAAVELLTRALGLWRGRVLEGLPMAGRVQPLADRLEDRRVDVAEDRVEALLALHQHDRVIAELRSLAEQHPLRERLWGQLMLALYRSGRQAEALATYQRLYRLLDEELGIGPGDALRELQQQILHADPRLRTAPTARVVPRELPADVAPFIGRAAELAAVDRALTAGSAGLGPAVVAVSGAAGVGKTALAMHWAHHALSRYPDGCLYVDLRGYGPEEPVDPAEVLAMFLRSLGHGAVPAGRAERAAAYRTLLAGRRVLIVLDDARSAEQVRPLLPGSAGCAVLVTSRDALAGLVARDGAARVRVGLLPMVDCVALLRALIGPGVDAEPATATDLAEHCARLPLALRLAAELAAARPAGTVADLAAMLRDVPARLDVLGATGSPGTSLRAAFSWFYRLVDVLTRAHLLQEIDPDRYELHDLLREHAAELGAADDGPLAAC
jgi:DNA-binding SARP family transcriptional activator